MSPVDSYTLMEQAHDYLRAAVRGVPADGWGRPTPCTAWTVRQVLNHARLDQQALVMQIGGSVPAGDPFEPVDTLTPDPLGELAAVLDESSAAWESVGRDAEEVTTPVGTVTAQVGTALAALDAAVHAWDIARATGQDLPLSDELAAGLLEPVGPFVDFVRANYGKYGPAVAVPEHTGAGDRLLAFTGRDPQWKP
ncbi:TIGR03086 family protein [Streptomyces sp. SID14478]|uniref:TIGR03086 family metal-binding protein n=1 Tax=Streptomyces sp. SID14478 TaxID=2706073 RepID=UPI0013DAF4C7|nr:TIGR03086 family metal-binding protein [Streptomyces sp. SID14478]NEB78290.1 TIGR03086 family protein [Streptomyces sp. SID14478]